MAEIINIAEIARGALIEQTDDEVKKVVANILDLNTDLKKARKVQITITFKPTDRESCNLEIQTKSTLVPPNAVGTQIYMGKDNAGNVVAAEYVKGTIPGQESIDYETGEILEDKKVVNMKKGER